MFRTLFFSLACAFGLLCETASAEETTNLVARHTDWSVFVEKSPIECWAVTAPKESVNTRNGKRATVRRGNIALFVFNRPDSDVKSQVTFTGGYPFSKKLIIKLDLDGVVYDLSPDPMSESPNDEWAWPPSPAHDAKIIDAMKRGAKAVVTAQSERGTVTKDTFSLKGFTAAVKDAAKRCAG